MASHSKGCWNGEEMIWQKLSKEHNRSLAAWSSGMILPQGARSPGLNSRSSPFLSPRRIGMQTKRQRGNSNPCGQSPMDFESISLTARAQCHGHNHWHNKQTHKQHTCTHTRTTVHRHLTATLRGQKDYSGSFDLHFETSYHWLLGLVA